MKSQRRRPVLNGRSRFGASALQIRLDHAAFDRLADCQSVIRRNDRFLVSVQSWTWLVAREYSRTMCLVSASEDVLVSRTRVCPDKRDSDETAPNVAPPTACGLSRQCAPDLNRAAGSGRAWD